MSGQMNFITTNFSVICIIVISTIVLASSIWMYFLIYMIKSLKQSPKLKSYKNKNYDANLNDNFPKVSIIVPARNEEKYIEKCLVSLLKQDYPNYVIVAVNDSSSDNTAEIMQNYYLRNPKKMKVVNSLHKPDGWSGKNWACYLGYLKSTGDILLFIDSDTLISSPIILSSAIRHMIEEKLDALTARPHLICEDIWTKITMPMLWTFSHIKYSALRINDPNNKKTGYLFGCFYLVSRRTFEAIGTHEAVKSEISEDAELGRKIKEEGFKLKAFSGEQYIESIFTADTNGIQRIVIPLYNKNKKETYFTATYIFFLTLYPFLLLPLSFSFLLLNNNNSSVIDVLVIINLINISIITIVYAIQLKLGLFENPVYALASPIAGAIISFGFIFSIINAIRSSDLVVKWRGRTYNIADEQM